ncbi:MAG: GNAT family N-acetyltransferase [Promethearchaeota archaeon]
MDVAVLPLTREYYLPLEKIYIQIVGDFSSPEDLNNFRRYIRYRSDLVKIAIHNSRIIGYIIGNQSSSLKPGIFSLYVVPDFRKRQIGSKLLHKLEREFTMGKPNLQYLSVRIPESFFDSKVFFLKQGFDVITTINCYAKDNLSFPYQVNPKIEIRSATKKDLIDLIKLEKICFSDYWQKNSDDFKKEIESTTNSLLLALIEGKLVGYNSNSVSINRMEGIYARIATLPQFRKQHVATSLTVKAFQWFRKQKVQKILLTTFADSEIHNIMYKGWGFKFIEQELIMAKKFKGLIPDITNKVS